jgi:hypothetical protein
LIVLLYMYSGKLTLAGCTFDEFESLAVAPRRRWRIFQPPLRGLHQRQRYSAYFRRPCREQALGGMLGAMARIALLRLATPPNG